MDQFNKNIPQTQKADNGDFFNSLEYLLIKIAKNNFKKQQPDST
jgi:hypothetical protein